jgi:hypothetical protein
MPQAGHCQDEDQYQTTESEASCRSRSESCALGHRAILPPAAAMGSVADMASTLSVRPG